MGDAFGQSHKVICRRVVVLIRSMQIVKFFFDDLLLNPVPLNKDTEMIDLRIKEWEKLQYIYPVKVLPRLREIQVEAFQMERINDK